MTKRISIADSFAECQSLLNATKSPATVRMYKIGLKYFYDRSTSDGLVWVKDLTIEDFISFASFLATSNYSSSSRRVYISAVSFYLNWLVTMGYWEPSLADLKRFETAKREWVGKSRSSHKMVQPEDIEKLIQIAETDKLSEMLYYRQLAIVHLLYSSGCRVSEIVDCRLTDLDMDQRRGFIVGKGNKTRSMFFSSTTASHLFSYWKLRENSSPMSFVIARHDSKAQSSISSLPISTSAIRRIIARLNIKAGFEIGFITPHSFRHAFAIYMLQKTDNLALVQDLLGHSSPETTRVYARFTESQLAQRHQEIWRDR